MITEIKIFLEKFFKAELDAHNAKFVPDLENYNQKINEMYSFCHPDLFESFGITKEQELRDQAYYEKKKNFKFKYPRFLFKISQYKNKEIGDIYIAYVSRSAMNSANFVTYSEALLVHQIDGTYKIIGDYFISSEYPDNIHWVKGSGIEANTDLTFANIGDLIAVERYKEPDVDEEYEPELSEFCLKEHNADK